MKIGSLFFALFFLVLFSSTEAQNAGQGAQIDLLFSDFDDSHRGNKAARIAFWNVENLFDTYDDPVKRDDEFTPNGNNHWNNFKYQKKLQKLSKTIIALGGWEPVEVICFAEVENRKVVEDLFETTALAETNYKIIHQESPDRRGIDVALAYRPDKFKVVRATFIKVQFSEDTRPTRDILYVRGKLNDKAEVHLFVNHWPSRYGGQMVTDPKRRAAADLVRSKVDSILSVDNEANIIITGDFNDEPEDASLIKHLETKLDTTNLQPNELYNMMGPLRFTAGTHKFAGHWGVLDQFFISHAIVNGANRLENKTYTAGIFAAPFLLEEDKTHLGSKLSRTYQGPKYLGGYSDHLPIYLDLRIVNKALLDF